MSYLLDTNAWINYLNPGVSPVRMRLASLHAESVSLCSVVRRELWYGTMRSLYRSANAALLLNLFGTFPSLPFDDKAADRYAEIRVYLEARGKPIGANDDLIAAIALANDKVLVTHNIGEFSRVPGLQIEDWQAG